MENSEYLARLDQAAVLAYEEVMGRTLADPGRLKAVYTARFAAEPVRERIRLICETARTMLRTDGSEANLVTDTEQIDIVAGTSKNVEASLCKFVVAERSALRVESATTHNLVCVSQAVTELGVRSYLGLPLIWETYAVGAFCVYSFTERQWLPHEVQVLAGLAATVVDTMHWDKD